MDGPGVGTSSLGFILQVLKECKLLELLILEEDRDDDDDRAILDDDSKIPISGKLESWTGDYRVVSLHPVADDLGFWEIGARGGQDHWVIAEMVKDVRMKYKGIR